MVYDPDAVLLGIKKDRGGEENPVMFVMNPCIYFSELFSVATGVTECCMLLAHTVEPACRLAQ